MENNNINFMIGADTSCLEAMEDQGAVFYDIDGEEKDALEILAAHGVNYIRLRLFNRPTESFDRGDYCNVSHTLLMAKRIKKCGLGFMLDFHYSDFWADWKAQKIPSDWQNRTAGELEESIYQYTKTVVERFIEQKAAPDIVQIGNEIGKGLLWDYGCIENTRQIARFLNAGLRAIEDINISSNLMNSQCRIKTMLHIECGADKERTEKFFTDLYGKGLNEFDYIGLSYYPYWSGDYALLETNMENIERKFDKKVVIVETAFPYTDESHDDMPNVVTGELTQKAMGLKPSVKNQQEVIGKIIEKVESAPNGAGVFYWEPVWYQIPGVGVSKGKGNEWENQAMFDNTGHALESIRAFERQNN